MLDETVCAGPLLLYKNTSRLARGDDVDVVELYTYGNSAITHSQAYVVETARATWVSCQLAFLGCPRCIVDFGSKKKG